MTDTTPLPSQPTTPPTWKDILSPSWPAMMGIALTTIGVFDAMHYVLLFAIKCKIADTDAILPAVAMFIPTVLLLIAGTQLLMRTPYARIYCLIYACAYIVSQLIYKIKYFLQGDTTLNLSMYMLVLLNQCLLPVFVILWMSREPVRREIHRWNPNNNDGEEPAKIVGWYTAMGWIAITLGLIRLADTLACILYDVLTVSGLDLKAYILDANLVLPCLAYAGIIVSGYFLLTKDRAGAYLMIVTAAGVLIIIGCDSITYDKSMWLNTDDRLSFMEPLAKLLGRLGAPVFLFWWFCRPSVWRDMAAWEKSD